MPGAMAELSEAAAVGPEERGIPFRWRAWVKIAIFLLLVALFDAIVEALLVYIPFDTRPGPLSWRPEWGYMLLMWSVGFAGLITLAATDRSWRDLGFKSVSRDYWLIAAALPAVYGLAVYVPVWILGLGEFAGLSRLEGAVLSAGLHLPLYLLAAMGEEVGWRGVLVPNLARTADARLVAFLPGAVWAVWHYPDLLLLGHPATPMPLALIFFSLMLIGHGVFLSWLRLASGSVWPAVVFHGVHNAVIYSVFDRVTGPVALYVTTEHGIGLAIASAVIAYIFWPRLRVLLVRD
jgi:uncharacterized protein